MRATPRLLRVFLCTTLALLPVGCFREIDTRDDRPPFLPPPTRFDAGFMTDAPFTRDTSGDGGGAYVTGTQFFAEASCRAGMPQILIEVYDESLPSCAPAGSPDLILILTARWTGAPGPIELEAGGPEGMIMLRDGFISFEGGVPVSISWAVDASLPPVLQGGGVDLRGECAVLGDLC